MDWAERPRRSVEHRSADYPILIKEDKKSRVLLKQLTPWEREWLLRTAIPGFAGTLRLLPSGEWLVSCSTAVEQGRLFRLDKLPGDITFSTRKPEPIVVGVLRGIPKEGGIEAKILADLNRQGLRVDTITRLDMAGGVQSSAVRVSFIAKTLPAEVKLGS